MLVAAALFSGATATADTAILADAKDSQGFLDIKKTRAAHGQGARLKHSISTYATWRPRHLDCASFGFVFPDQDRYLAIFWRKGELHARISDHSDSGNPSVVGYPRIWRRDDRTVVVSFRRAHLGRGLESYRWRAVAGSPSEPCPPEGSGYGIAVDKAPDKWNERHSL